MNCRRTLVVFSRQMDMATDCFRSVPLAVTVTCILTGFPSAAAAGSGTPTSSEICLSTHQLCPSVIQHHPTDLGLENDVGRLAAQHVGLKRGAAG